MRTGSEKNWKRDDRARVSRRARSCALPVSVMSYELVDIHSCDVKEALAWSSGLTRVADGLWICKGSAMSAERPRAKCRGYISERQLRYTVVTLVYGYRTSTPPDPMAAVLNTSPLHASERASPVCVHAGPFLSTRKTRDARASHHHAVPVLLCALRRDTHLLERLRAIARLRPRRRRLRRALR